MRGNSDGRANLLTGVAASIASQCDHLKGLCVPFLFSAPQCTFHQSILDAKVSLKLSRSDFLGRVSFPPLPIERGKTLKSLCRESSLPIPFFFPLGRSQESEFPFFYRPFRSLSPFMIESRHSRHKTTEMRMST